MKAFPFFEYMWKPGSLVLQSVQCAQAENSLSKTGKVFSGF
jgi:hypothetical protein